MLGSFDFCWVARNREVSGGGGTSKCPVALLCIDRELQGYDLDDGDIRELPLDLISRTDPGTEIRQSANITNIILEPLMKDYVNSIQKHDSRQICASFVCGKRGRARL